MIVSRGVRDNGGMTCYPPRSVNQQAIAEGVERAVKMLAPDVVKILYNYGEDWTGVPSIFFRVLLEDNAVKNGTLGGLGRKIKDVVEREAQLSWEEMNSYFNFRTSSEQADLKDPMWA